MNNAHGFLIGTFLTLTAACAVAAGAMAPVEGNRAGTAAGFAFFGTMAAAGAALTVAATADALTPASRRR
jgi:nicotinamide mononucleotide (NMN) deamidase PncC